MIKIYLIIIIILTAIGSQNNNLFAQTPDWLWAKSANGGAGNSVSTDASGNIYVAGYFYTPTITFGNTILTDTTANTRDIFLVKYDASGNVIWAKSFGGTEDDDAFGVSADASGNVYITGNFSSPTITFGTTLLNNPNSPGSAIFLARCDTAGNVIWAKTAPAFNAYSNSVATDANDNVYITGYFYSPTIVFGTATLNGGPDGDVFLVKYDASGIVIWAKSAGGGKGVSVVPDAVGNIYVTGNSAWNTSLTFGSITLTNSGRVDVFLAKYDATGNVDWAVSPTGSASEWVCGVAIDTSNNILIAGRFDSPSITFGTTTLINAGPQNTTDIFLTKYDASGNVIWAKREGGNLGEGPYGVATDIDGSAYITGWFSSTFNFGNSSLINAGADDIFLAKYDASGNVAWVKNVGGNGNEEGNSVTIDVNKNIYVTGRFISPTLTFGSNTLANPYVSMFLAKINSVVGVEEIGNDNEINIYPNPTNGNFNYVLKTDDKNAQLKVYNILGELVLLNKLSSGNGIYKGTIDLTDYQNGIYFVIAETSNTFITQRIMKQ